MKEIYVNRIIEQKGITQGLVVLNKTVFKNLELLFDDKVNAYFKSLVMSGQEFHSTDRYCQYVVLTMWQKALGFTMKVSDYHNDLNIALDEYTELTHKAWQKEDRDKIMRIFQQIESDPDNKAKMVILDPVS